MEQRPLTPNLIIMLEIQTYFPLVIEESFKPRRLVIPDDCTDDSFRALIKIVRRCSTSAAFWTADLLSAANQRYGASEATRILVEEGFTAHELTDAQCLAALPERKETLSLEHHLAASRAPVERQLEWLNVADESKLSPAELKRSIRVGSVVRESAGEGEDTGQNGRSNFRFATIEGIASEFNLWLRQVERDLERADPDWVAGIAEKTRIMTDVLTRIRSLCNATQS